MVRLVLLGCLAYLTIGLGQLVVGAVMEPMVHAYGVQYGDGGQLVMNQFLGGLVGTLCAPWLLRKLGKKRLLLGALAFMLVAELSYTLLPPWGVMLAIAPVAGFGFGITEPVVGSFIIGSAGDKANTAMSRVEVFFGAGALVMPFVGALLIDIEQWRWAFGLVGVLSAITLLLWAFFWPSILNRPLDAEAAHAGSADAPARKSLLGRGPMRWVLITCAVFFAIYVGFEMSFAHYLPSLLVQNNGLSDATATLALSAFWGAMTIGRLFAGQLADRWGGVAYLLSMCGAAAVMFVLMGALGGAAAMFVLAFGAGLAMSGMFAVALVFANRSAPGMTERTTSMLMACGLLGGAVLPKGTGWFLDQYGADATRWMLAVLAVLMLAVMAAAAAASRSARLSKLNPNPNSI
ncbi:MFS transporter [Cohnella nanjingensis]|uniref:MFS transporter n=1 Tax=Cohnella nanjingensis TaxID=1387779 RepID=A0A7X0RQC0_9BACL|nr:MFS transporter [Cohnella nanjingensis]MBB6670324.1 MFS transporter [Cohnella nanjingensis]